MPELNEFEVNDIKSRLSTLHLPFKKAGRIYILFI